MVRPALAYGEALTTRGYVGDAADVYEQLIATDYILGYYALAWLERDHGNHDRAQSLLRAYLDADRHPDEYTDHVAGVLGHWLWHFSNRTDAEPLLRREPFSFLQRAPI
jgi:tetratricopeptide (TPR) repeat protein